MPESSAAGEGGRNRDLVRLYTGMVRTLESEADGSALGELFERLTASGESRPLPLAQDDEVRRMLLRTGHLPEDADVSRQGKLTEDLVRETAERVGRTPARVSLVFRLYAAGMYGFLPEPVCGAAPRCPACGITKLCEWYNRPPRQPPESRLPLPKRFARYGAEALSDEELLSVLLGGARADRKAADLARTLLERYGSLRGLAGARFGEVAGLRDVTETAAVRILAAAAIHTRIQEERRAAGPAMRSGKDFFDLYAPGLRDLRQEVFLVVLLDQKNRVLKDERVSMGTLTNSLVHPREVFAPAVRDGAAAVAFVHNHPSGDCTPSPEDRSITKRLVEVADIMGIRILDHVIVGEGAYTSFVDEGLL